MSNEWRVLSGKDEIDDSKLKNKFSWKWFEEEFSGEKVGVWCRKVAKAGYCICIRCGNAKINYGSSGKQALKNHVDTEKHRKSSVSAGDNELLPSSTPTANNQRVPLSDRIHRMEGMMLTFAAENRLPTSMVPRLARLCQATVKDPVALSSIHLKSDNTAGYKLREGLGGFWKDDLSAMLKDGPYSLTADESTSESGQRVLNIMVKFWCDGRVVVQHLKSVELFKLDASTITCSIIDSLTEMIVPLENCVSVYTDGCNVMRGIHIGVQKQLKVAMQQLIDIGGDAVHVVHNASKHFSTAFQDRVEHLLDALYVDLSEVNLRSHLQQLANVFGMNIRSFPRRLEHRWLSQIPGLELLLENWSLYRLFYSAFLPETDSHLFDLDEAIDNKVTPEGKKIVVGLIRSLKDRFKVKRGGSAVVCRRNDIIKELFTHRDEFFTIASFQMTVLDILQDFVKFFQADTPLIHKMVPEMKRLVRRLSALVVKPKYLEFIDDKTFSPTKLLPLEEILLTVSQSESVEKSVLLEIAKKAQKGVTDTVTHMLRKLPVSNDTLKCFEALDPEKRLMTHSLTKLKLLSNHIQTETSKNASLIKEITEYCSDRELPSSNDSDGRPLPLDVWWNSVGLLRNSDNSLRYSSLYRLVKPAITCFHGPKVEGSFSLMNMTSTEFRPRLSVETMNVTLYAQYRRKLFGDSVSQLGSSNPRSDPVPPGLLQNMRKAWKLRRETQVSNRLVKKAAMRLTEAGMKEKREREQRKQMMKERRRKLVNLIERQKSTKRLMRSLPPIPKVAHVMEEAENVTQELDLIDTFATLPPKKKTKQADIRAMFFKPQ